MKKRFHFIAIGGAAMHNLAISLHKSGHIVTGSDDQIFDPACANLKKYNLLPEATGWFPEKITNQLDAVILGMHARIDNPELQKAKELGVQIFSFPEFIYEHSIDKKRIVIGGSHGKTSITGMILHVMKNIGIETDYLLGASVPGVDGNVSLSDKTDVIVIEGDEYLTSPIDLRPKFHLYKPHIAVISGIAWDHINVFRTFEEYKKQFQIFADLIEPQGTLIYCADDSVVLEIAGNSRNDIKKMPYSLPDHTLNNGTTFLETPSGKTRLEVFGNHNLLNIEAARKVCNEIGISDKMFYEHISDWKGAYNRLTKIHDSETLTIFRDFAHAPSKVEATINAVRSQYSEYSFIACLELHTYSSLSKEFLSHYRGTMDACDVPFLFFDPHAVEIKKLEMPNNQDIMNGFSNDSLRIFNNSNDLQQSIKDAVRDKTVVLYMTSGNFNNIDFCLIV